MAAREVEPQIGPILPGDVVDDEGHVSRGGEVPLRHREVLHKNQWGLTVVRDTLAAGGIQDWQTYGPGEVTAAMLLPIDDTLDHPNIVLVEGFQHGLGRRTLEAPGARVKDGTSPAKTAFDIAQGWGIRLSGVWPMGQFDETSGRQYNVTETYEGPISSMDDDPRFRVRGEGPTRNVRVVMPLGEAYQLARRGELTNGLTSNLILTAAVDRGMATPTRRNVGRR